MSDRPELDPIERSGFDADPQTNGQVHHHDASGHGAVARDQDGTYRGHDGDQDAGHRDQDADFGDYDGYQDGDFGDQDGHQSSEQQPNPLLAGLRDGTWLDAQVFPPLGWVVPALLPEGLSLLVGAPKIGKSWLSLAIALAVASGGEAFSHIAVGDPRPVLLLALEDSDRRLQDRIRTLIPGEPIPGRLYNMTRIQQGRAVATIEAWLETLPSGCGAPYVILDTLGRIMPPALTGESAYQRDYRVASRLKTICDDRPGMALTGLHHDRKASADDFVDAVSGTNGIAGAADTIVVLNRQRNESDGLLKITGRDVAENEYAVAITDGGWTLVGDSLNAAMEAANTIRATANLGDLSAEVLRFVTEHPEGVRPADVSKAVNLTPKEAAVYLGRLFNAGKIDKPKRGLYIPVVTVASVVSEGADDPESNTYNGYNSTLGREDELFPGTDICGDCGEPYSEPGLVRRCRDRHRVKEQP
jgi:hypothetical protein